MHRAFLIALLLLSLLSPTARADSICFGFPDDTFCQPLDKCLAPGKCQHGNCLPDPTPGAPMYAMAGTICVPSSNPCFSDRVCDGTGMCLQTSQYPSGTVCDPTPEACTGTKVCNDAGQCLPTSTAPPGTVCGFSLNPCIDDSRCSVSGACVAGMPLPAMTACAPVTVCSGMGACNGAGSCLSASQNEGHACAGADVCQDYTCLNGTCASIGPRDCSGGNPCLKKDSCTPGVGCMPTPICDMTPQDLSSRDLSGADLTSTQQPDLTGQHDLAAADLSHDLAASLPDQSSPAPDQGPDAAHLRVRVTGGACQYAAGQQPAPAAPLATAALLGLSLLLRLLRLGLLTARRRAVAPRRRAR